MNRLKNKIILITGASSGIGRATAEAFASYGAHLILTARREKELQELQAKLSQQHGIKIYTHVLDVQDKAQVEAFFAAIPADLRGVDVLVNNAGLSLGLVDLANGDVADWETMINTNVKGLLYITRATLEIMYQQNRGQIINIGSIAGIQPYAKGAVYCGVKAAVHAISRSLRE